MSKRLFFDDPIPTLDQALVLTQELREEGELGVSDYLEGTAYHQEAEELRYRLGPYLEKVADGKSAASMSREEWERLYAEWPEKDVAEEAETKALEAYRRASTAPWRIMGLGRSGELAIGSEHMTMQRLDLEWRIAEREPDAALREERLDALEEAFMKALEFFDDKGVRAEYQFMAILRHQLREREMDHAVTVEHALPRQDLNDKYKEDLVLNLPPFRIPIQQKTLDLSDSNKRDIHTEIIERERRKIQARSISNTLIKVDVRDLADAAKSYKEGKLGNQRKLLEFVVAQLPDGPRQELARLVEVEKPKERIYANDADLQNFLKPMKLVELGYLSVDDARDVSKLLAAKKAATKELSSRKPTLEDLRDPESSGKLKRAG